ncbi:M56 family metallopeptidase [Colwellia psychrerythraea]|uniref:TonB family protein n=1 Tax=Colwellia psychrerythraea TaxID=28229 RepID=A0A099KLP6_COLPS|nr:M56 family metallopeptidase [Colwellia psychrerythraea]KGJ91130.1 TonB family protein [Colwellia psychrerythraea]
MFEQLFSNPFLYSLSLTLVHFLWQGLLVALILKSALYIIDKNKSKLRYGVAAFAMLSNLILALLTFVMVYPDTSSGINSNLSPMPLTSLVNELTQQNTLLTYQELLPSILAYSLPYISLLWLATITILASKLLIEVRNVNNLPLQSSVSPSSALLARFDQLAKQIKLPKTPRLLISLKAEVPMAIGWLKPVVLLPASMVTGLDSAQLEMLILHELAHIRRHDYLVNFLQTLIELLFFFHPSVHWIGKQMRNEREYCSDDIAVQHCGDAIAYAHTLTDTASLCAKKHFKTIPTMAMAASGGDLKARVLRLVDHHCAPSNNISKWLAAISLLLALTLLSINQILTMPFAHQLNNQFPWQESNSLSKSIFQSTVATIGLDKTRDDNKAFILTSDSIAQQLLNRENSASETPLMGIATSDTREEISNNIASIPSNVEQLPLESSEFETSAIGKKLIIDKENLKVLASPSDVFSTEKVNIANLPLLINPKKSIKEEPKISTANLEVNDLDEQLTIQTEAQHAVIPDVKIVLSTVSQPRKSAHTYNVTKVSSLSAKLDQLAKVNPTLPINLKNGLYRKSTPYAKISYNQEINQLALQNSIYQDSHAFSSNSEQVLEQYEIQSPSKKTTTYHEPKLLNSISPVYPNLAKRRGIEMEVKVNFTIGRNGKVKDIIFAQQSKLIYFKSSIRSAIRKWRFKPAIKNNLKIESKMSKIFSFSLHA